MSDDAPERKTSPPELGASTAEATPTMWSRVGRVLTWLTVALLAAVVCVQLAGVLLRDRLENRRSLIAQPPPPAPAAPGESKPKERPVGPEPSRFGPEVQEVIVARPTPGTSSEQGHDAPTEGTRPPTSAAAAKEPPAVEPKPSPAPPLSPGKAPEKPVAAKAIAKVEPAAQKPKVTQAAQSVVPPPPKKEVSPRPPQEPPRAAERGGHVLLVDTFLSQQYLRQSEERLRKLGAVPLRTEFQRKGKGFKVTLGGASEADRERGRKALDAAGIIYRAASDGLEAFFYFRHEAQSLSDMLSKQGLQPAVVPVDAERPHWKLFAGPYAEDDARKIQQKLSAAGLKTFLERRP